MVSRGRAQREAVTVIFRLLEAVSNGNIHQAHSLLSQAMALDEAGVNSGLLEAIGYYLESDASADSKQKISLHVAGTPYEVAAATLVDRE